MAHFVDASEDIAALGARLAVVGNGSVDALGRFSARYSGTVDFYTDPNLEAYGALGMKAGMASLLSVKMVSHAVRASRGGHRQGKTEGHPWQQGGVCVFAAGGEMLFVHRDATAGDHVTPDRILQILAQAKTPG